MCGERDEVIVEEAGGIVRVSNSPVAVAVAFDLGAGVGEGTGPR